jgi:hypothetical protein
MLRRLALREAIIEDDVVRLKAGSSAVCRGRAQDRAVTYVLSFTTAGRVELDAGPGDRDDL